MLLFLSRLKKPGIEYVILAGSSLFTLSGVNQSQYDSGLGSSWRRTARHFRPESRPSRVPWRPCPPATARPRASVACPPCRGLLPRAARCPWRRRQSPKHLRTESLRSVPLERRPCASLAAARVAKPPLFLTIFSRIWTVLQLKSQISLALRVFYRVHVLTLAQCWQRFTNTYFSDTVTSD